MALIPLKQKATVVKPEIIDDWGNTTPGERIEYKVRVDNVVKEVKNRMGQEVISTAQVWFNKYPDVKYEDTLEYVDEHGNSIVRKPELIDPIRMINGKPTLTIVYL